MKNQFFLKLSTLALFAIATLTFSSCTEDDTMEESTVEGVKLDEKLVKTYFGKLDKFDGSTDDVFDFTNFAVLKVSGENTYQMDFIFPSEKDSDFPSIENIKFTANTEGTLFVYLNAMTGTSITLTIDGTIKVVANAPTKFEFTNINPESEELEDCTSCALDNSILGAYEGRVFVNSASKVENNFSITLEQASDETYTIIFNTVAGSEIPALKGITFAPLAEGSNTYSYVETNTEVLVFRNKEESGKISTSIRVSKYNNINLYQTEKKE